MEGLTGTLSLQRSNIETLKPWDFAGLIALQSLRLDNNSLTTLLASVLFGLTALQELRLDNNSLTTLSSRAFSGLTALRKLRLGDNSLTTLPAGIFSGLTALQALRLRSNRLTALHPGIFSGLRALQDLYLQNNELTVLPAGLFNDLRSLGNLRLANNLSSGSFRPIANAGANQVAEAGRVVTLRAVVSDVDPWGDNAAYSWTQTDNSGVMARLTGAGTATPGFVMPAGAAELEFEFRVTGRGGNQYIGTDRVVVRLIPDTVVTLSGPGTMMTTTVDEDRLRLVYSYSADDLRGRTLTGSIEVEASIDGVAVPLAVRVDGARGEISIVLERAAWPGTDERLLTVALRTAAANFVLGEPNSITTSFSFVPVAVVTLSGPGAAPTTGVDEDVLRLVYSYSADELHGRALSGSIEVAAAIDGVPIAPAVRVDGARGDISIVLERAAWPGTDERLLTVALRAAAANFVLGEPNSITTRFSFLPVAVVTLSGPGTMMTTTVDEDVLRLVYSYSADDLRGRTLEGSIEVEAAVDGMAITPAVRVDGARGEISIVLERTAWPGDDERLLRVALRAAAAGFVLGEPNSVATRFSFVPVSVVTLSGPGEAPTTAVDEDVLRLVYSYSADDLQGRTLEGSIEVEAAVDGMAITPAVRVDGARGEISIVLERAAWPGADERLLTVALRAAAAGFVLSEPNSITTRFSFVPVAVVTLSGPGTMMTTTVDEDVLRLVYSYSADDLRGRTLEGSIEVEATVDGVAVTPAVRVDGTRGEISIVLERAAWPGADERLLRVALRAAAAGFVLGEPNSITTRFSFVPVTVVTLSGPGTMMTTTVDEDVLRLVYSYSADDLRGRALAGSIEVEAAVDGVAVTPAVRVDGTRGEISIVLERAAWPGAAERLLRVALRAAAAGFVLGEPNSITTNFSFVPVSVVTLSEPGTMMTTTVDEDVLRLVYSYSADDLRGRALTGSIEVEATVDGVPIAPAVRVDGARGEVSIVLERAAWPGAAERLLRVALRAAAAGFVLGEPNSIATRFSFVPVSVVTLSGPGEAPTTGVNQDVLRLVYSYSADDLRGRALTGSIEVEATVDGVPIAPAVRVDGARGEISIVLERAAWPGADERLLRVALRAAAAGFVLGEPNSITTNFSFVPVSVVTLSGPGAAPTTTVDEDVLRLVYSYSADDLRGRALAGSIEVEASIDGVAITPAVRVDGARGEISIALERAAWPGADERLLRVALRAAAAGFVLGEPNSITTRFSFVPVTVVTLSGPGAAPTTGVNEDVLRLVYSYSADDLRGRALTGSIEVEATVDGVPIAPAVRVDGARGEISIALERAAWPGADERLLRVALRAAAAGFVLGEPNSITTRFSFVPVSVVTLAGPGTMMTTTVDEDRLRLVYSYSADDLRGRTLEGSIEVEATVDGVAVTPAVRVDEGRGEISIVLERTAWPGAAERLLRVALRVAAAGFVLGEPNSITTNFSFVPVTVVTLSGPGEAPTTGVDQDRDRLRLVYSYSADDLQGRTLEGSIEVEAAVDGMVITPAVRVDGARGEISIVLERAAWPGDDERLLRVALRAAAAGFVLGEPNSIATRFSFVPVTVVTLSGPGAAPTIGVDEDVLRLVYSYSADDLRGRALTGSIEVEATVDGVPIAPAVRVDGARGEVSIALERAAWPGAAERLLRVALRAAAAGFVLGEPNSITTNFSFVPVTVVTLSGPGEAPTTGVDEDVLRLVYSYSADDLQGRALMGSIEVEAAVDGVPIAPAVRVDGTRGEISIVLERAAWPGDDVRLLTVALRATAAGFVLGEANSITTRFSFVPVTVVTLSGPGTMMTTTVDEDRLRLVYSYSADDLQGRTLSGSIEVEATVDGVPIAPAVRVDGARGEISIVLERAAWPGADERLLRVALRAAAAGFVLGEPNSITTRFSFVPVTVVTLSGPGEAPTTGVDEDVLRLVYSYSVDDLRGRALEGSIEVEAAVDGMAIIPAVRVDGARGEISIVLERAVWPGDDVRLLTVALRATAAGFVLGESNSITTSFSFVPVAVVTLSGPGAAPTTTVDEDVLRLVYSYSADDLRGRALTGSIEVAAAIDGVPIAPAVRVEGTRGEISIVLERAAWPGADERLLRVALRAAAAGFVLGEPNSITTSFSFVPVTVVTLSGPGTTMTTGVDEDVLRLVYSYSADDLQGRALTGSIEVEATVDGVALTRTIQVDEGRGEISIVLERAAWPGADERLLTVALRAAAAGFVLGEPNSITTRFSFISVTVVTLSGPGTTMTTTVDEDRLRLVYSYSADDLRGRALTGSVEVEASIDGVAITPAVRVDGARGEISIVLERAAWPGDDERLLRVALKAAAAGFVLGEANSITTSFSFVPVTVVTLSGPGTMMTTPVDEDVLRLVYSYSADDLRGRTLAGSIEVAAEVNGAMIIPALHYVDETGGRGGISIVLERADWPGDDVRLLTVALRATAAGFVLSEPNTVTTRFSFVPVAVVTLSGPVPAATTDITQDELRLVYSYSVADLRGRTLEGSIEVAASVDGVAITPAIRVDEARGEISIVLERDAWPGTDEHLLAVTLSLAVEAAGFALGESSSSTILFNFAMTLTAIADDGSCQLGMLAAGESCRYRGSSQVVRVVEGPRLFFFLLSETGESINIEDASNTLTLFDTNIYNLEAVPVGQGYQIIRIYNPPQVGALDDGSVSSAGGLDGATLLLAVLFLLANTALAQAGRRRRRPVHRACASQSALPQPGGATAVRNDNRRQQRYLRRCGWRKACSHRRGDN